MARNFHKKLTQLYKKCIFTMLNLVGLVKKYVKHKNDWVNDKMINFQFLFRTNQGYK
jgi:hypothetical protein